MSVAAVKWALSQRVPDPTAKLVLVSLAHAHNAKNGECKPSQKRLAEEAGTTVRTVRRHLASLRAAGLIGSEQWSRSSGATGGCSYLLPLSPTSPPPVTPMTPRGDARVTPPLSPMTPPGDTHDRGSTYKKGIRRELIKEPLRGKKRENDPKRSPEDHSMFKALWKVCDELAMGPPLGANGSARSGYAELVWGLVDEGVTPDDVRVKVAAYRQHDTLGQTMLTLPALTKWWGTLEANGHSDSGAERLRRAMAERGIT